MVSTLNDDYYLCTLYTLITFAGFGLTIDLLSVKLDPVQDREHFMQTICHYSVFKNKMIISCSAY